MTSETAASARAAAASPPTEPPEPAPPREASSRRARTAWTAWFGLRLSALYLWVLFMALFSLTLAEHVPDGRKLQDRLQPRHCHLCPCARVPRPARRRRLRPIRRCGHVTGARRFRVSPAPLRPFTGPRRGHRFGRVCAVRIRVQDSSSSGCASTRSSRHWVSDRSCSPWYCSYRATSS